MKSLIFLFLVFFTFSTHADEKFLNAKRVLQDVLNLTNAPQPFINAQLEAYEFFHTHKTFSSKQIEKIVWQQRRNQQSKINQLFSVHLENALTGFTNLLAGQQFPIKLTGNNEGNESLAAASYMIGEIVKCIEVFKKSITDYGDVKVIPTSEETDFNFALIKIHGQWFPTIVHKKGLSANVLHGFIRIDDLDHSINPVFYDSKLITEPGFLFKRGSVKSTVMGFYYSGQQGEQPYLINPDPQFESLLHASVSDVDFFNLHSMLLAELSHPTLYQDRNYVHGRIIHRNREGAFRHSFEPAGFVPIAMNHDLQSLGFAQEGMTILDELLNGNILTLLEWQAACPELPAPAMPQAPHEMVVSHDGGQTEFRDALRAIRTQFEHPTPEQQAALEREWEARRQHVIDNTVEAKNKTRHKNRNRNRNHAKKNSNNVKKPSKEETNSLVQEKLRELNQLKQESFQEGQQKFRDFIKKYFGIISSLDLTHLQVNQRGSHIVFHLPNKTPLTVVVVHGRDEIMRPWELKLLFNQLAMWIRS